MNNTGGLQLATAPPPMKEAQSQSSTDKMSRGAGAKVDLLLAIFTLPRVQILHPFSYTVSGG